MLGLMLGPSKLMRCSVLGPDFGKILTPLPGGQARFQIQRIEGTPWLQARAEGGRVFQAGTEGAQRRQAGTDVGARS